MRKVVLFAIFAAALVAAAAPKPATQTLGGIGKFCCDPPPVCPKNCPPVK